mmetsp:Transcript_34010/g.82275  ORF Transcript_34010/g.82275 Transcript_34010/m.82275 type:complete len:212 (+) Transcript_34010:144-779(+)
MSDRFLHFFPASRATFHCNIVYAQGDNTSFISPRNECEHAAVYAHHRNQRRILSNIARNRSAHKWTQHASRILRTLQQSEERSNLIARRDRPRVRRQYRIHGPQCIYYEKERGVNDGQALRVVRNVPPSAENCTACHEDVYLAILSPRPDETLGQESLGECVCDADEAHEPGVIGWSEVESLPEGCGPYGIEDVKCEGHIHPYYEERHCRP